MSSPRERLAQARLYGIADLGYLAPEELVRASAALLAGGVDLLQLRAKGFAAEEIEVLARLVLPLCREAGVPFIINDFPKLAGAVGADGIHVGQDDGSLREVREIVGPEMIVGRSTHSPAQAAAAHQEGFDYLGFGPLFPTPTKEGRPGIGLENIEGVQSTVGTEIPVFCIGGIKSGNLAEVLSAGARRVVVVSDLLQAEDITAATAELKARL